MLHPLGRKRALIGYRGLRQRGGDIAEFAMDFRDDVARRIGDPMGRRLVAVDDRRARCDRLRGIDHRGQDFIIDREPTTAFFGGGLGVGDHGGDLLPDEADDLVEHFGVVRVHPVLLMPRRREQPVRRVLISQHRLHAGNFQRGALVDRNDLRVRMRRAQHLDVQQAFRGDIERVALGAAHHVRAGGRGQAAAERGAGRSVLDIGLAVERILDRTITGAAADVALQRRAEVLALRLVQRRTGQDHTGGAEPALKTLRVEKRLLHRMNARRRAQSLRWWSPHDLRRGTPGSNSYAPARRRAVRCRRRSRRRRSPS